MKQKVVYLFVILFLLFFALFFIFEKEPERQHQAKISSDSVLENKTPLPIATGSQQSTTVELNPARGNKVLEAQIYFEPIEAPEFGAPDEDEQNTETVSHD